jgi:hypothetical protein
VNLFRYVANRPIYLVDPMGLDWADWVVRQMPNSWVDYLGSSRSNWIGHMSNYFAGHADALSFGLTSYARRGLGWDNVNYDSDYYLAGEVVGTAHSFALGYGAAGRVPQAGIWAYRGAQGYTVAGSVYGVGRSSYVLATDPQNFGFTDALGFVPLGGYVTSKGLTAARMWWRPPGGRTVAPVNAAPPVTLIGKGDPLAQAAKWIKPQQGVIDVVVHGSPDAFHVLHNGKWVQVNHRTLATLIEKSGQSGSSIRLIFCSSGASPTGVAQNLANKLGMKVTAPTDKVWIHPNGNLTIGKTATANTGQWVTFTPGGPR